VAPAEMLEFVADFVAVDARVVRRDLAKEFAKLGDIPLAVAESVDDAAICFFGGDVKGPEEDGIPTRVALCFPRRERGTGCRAYAEFMRRKAFGCIAGK